MQIKFNNLMLEVTRRCNMQCSHCMRGEEQDTSMSSESIKKIFSQTKSIKHLTITGGEPSLVPDIIEWIAYYAKNYGVAIGDFFCATNAKEYSEQFVKAINSLYAICKKKITCCLTISTDQFHNNADPKAWKEYKALPFYVPINEKWHLDKADIISEGRAKTFHLGRHEMIYPDYIYDYKLSCFNLCIGDRVYINADGFLLLGADMSYEKQEEHYIDNIHSKPLDEILMSCAYDIPIRYFEEDKKCFYGLHFNLEENTAYTIPLDETKYFETAQQVIVAYQNALNNIQITPINTETRKIPDDLQLEFRFLPNENNRCDGTKIIYKLPNKEPKTAIIEILKFPIEEVKENEW